ncbi:SpoIID/LytB domain-containing protein [Myxococcota bacterium]|nr:SpoIID/LytB domain-containing protein [Myxococcota bacterium]MBU1380502.1 SpoIID/LytB domain-containing protein [Myxococcota bacterium]MBU1497274.1 SpoIID/LytB domain-containing protein [Myxococcota bacterium]
MKKLISFIFIFIVFFSIPSARGSDTLFENLYQKKFTLDGKNIPLVSIGLFTGISSVRISSEKGLEIGTSTIGGIRLSVDKEILLQLTHGKKGEIEFWIALEDMPLTDWSESKKYSYKVKMIEHGYLIAMKGKMLDTRRALPSIGPFKSREEARKKLEVISKKWERAYIHSKLKTLPEGHFTARPVNNTFSLKYATALAFFPGKTGRLTVRSGNETIIVSGTVIVTLDSDGKLAVINELPVETYLEGILPSEMWPSAPMEALKAQAIAARGQVLAKMGTRHMTDPFHLCRKVHCQAYGGKLHASTSAACRATAGLVLFETQSTVVDTVYHSSCGGHTENNENAWGGIPKKTLRGRSDLLSGKLPKFWSHHVTRPQSAWCKKGNPSFRWKSTISLKDLARNLSTIGFNRTITRIEVIKRGISGRITALRVFSGKKSTEIKGELVIRKLFGNLKSSMFIHRFTPTEIEFTGAGFGHGVGMCQWGAINRAKAGQNYKTILSHYYYGSILKKLY